MTALDRLIEAIPEDGPIPRDAQVELVQALMRRDGKALSERRGPDPAVSLAEQPCPTCLVDTDDSGCCPICGHQNHEGRRRKPLGETRAAGQNGE